MPTFKNLKDLENYLKKNPEVVLKQNIGNSIKVKCPACKNREKIKITSKDKGKCSNCGSEIHINVTVD